MSLKELRIACKHRNIPIISVATEQFLAKILKKYKPKVCLEIGGAVGYSGIFMAEIIKQRWGKLYSFEISYPGYREWQYNAVKSQTHNLVSYPFNILQVAGEKLIIQNPVDFVFVDAQKAEYGAYLAKIENIIDKKTVIIIDDVIKYHHKLVSLYWYLQEKQIYYDIVKLDPDDGVMIINGEDSFVR